MTFLKKHCIKAHQVTFKEDQENIEMHQPEMIGGNSESEYRPTKNTNAATESAESLYDLIERTHFPIQPKNPEKNIVDFEWVEDLLGSESDGQQKNLDLGKCDVLDRVPSGDIGPVESHGSVASHDSNSEISMGILQMEVPRAISRPEDLALCRKSDGAVTDAVEFIENLWKETIQIDRSYNKYQFEKSLCSSELNTPNLYTISPGIQAAPSPIMFPAFDCTLLEY